MVFRNDGIESQFHCLSHTLLTGMPAHDGGSRLLHEVEVSPLGRHALVPAEEGASLGGGKVRHLLDEACLEFTVALQTQFLEACLAVGVVLPLVGGALVPSYMYIRIGEDVEEFRQDVLGKFHRLGIGHVHHVRAHAPVMPYLGSRLGVTAELWVSCQGRYEMPRHIYLGQYVDMTLSSVAYHLAHLFLRIEIGTIGLTCLTSLSGPVGLPVLHHLADGGVVVVGTGSPDGGQQRIAFDFSAPALVIGQVPVEDVHLVACHEVYEFLDFIHAEEMSAHIEHEAPVAKAWFVLNGHAGDVLARFLQLCQAHAGVEDTLLGTSLHADSLGRNLQDVSFRSHLLVNLSIDLQCFLLGQHTALGRHLLWTWDDGE